MRLLFPQTLTWQTRDDLLAPFGISYANTWLCSRKVLERCASQEALVKLCQASSGKEPVMKGRVAACFQISASKTPLLLWSGELVAADTYIGDCYGIIQLVSETAFPPESYLVDGIPLRISFPEHHSNWARWLTRKCCREESNVRICAWQQDLEIRFGLVTLRELKPRDPLVVHSMNVADTEEQLRKHQPCNCGGNDCNGLLYKAPKGMSSFPSLVDVKAHWCGELSISHHSRLQPYVTIDDIAFFDRIVTNHGEKQVEFLKDTYYYLDEQQFSLNLLPSSRLRIWKLKLIWRRYTKIFVGLSLLQYARDPIIVDCYQHHPQWLLQTNVALEVPVKRFLQAVVGPAKIFSEASAQLSVDQFSTFQPKDYYQRGAVSSPKEFVHHEEGVLLTADVSVVLPGAPFASLGVSDVPIEPSLRKEKLSVSSTAGRRKKLVSTQSQRTLRNPYFERGAFLNGPVRALVEQSLQVWKSSADQALSQSIQLGGASSRKRAAPAELERDHIHQELMKLYQLRKAAVDSGASTRELDVLIQRQLRKLGVSGK